MTLLELARKEGKAKVAIAARVNGVVMDLARPHPDGAKVEWVLPSDPDGVEILRHSTAHVMAAAVKELFPGALITIGPATLPCATTSRKKPSPQSISSSAWTLGIRPVPRTVSPSSAV